MRRQHASIRVLVLGILVLGFALPLRPAQAQLRDFAERAERVQIELDRTQELIDQVSDQVSEAEVPRARVLLAAAEQSQGRAVETFRAVGPDTPLLSAEAHLRQALSMTLRARDMAQRAGRQLHEMVGQQESARRTLERASELFDRLRSALSDSDNRQAGEILTQARRKMELAEAQYRDGNFEVALQLAESSVRMMQTLASDAQDSYGQRAQEELERTRALLDRAQERFGDAGGATAQQLARAEDLLRTAGKSVDNGRWALARRQLEDCRDILRNLMSQSGSEVEPSTVQNGIERIDTDLERLRDRLGRNLPAAVREQIDRIVGERDRAAQALRAGNTEQAVRHLRAASDLLNRLQRRLQSDRG